MMNSTWQKWYHSIGIEKVLPFLRLVQGTGKAPCLYQTNHWKCEHSSIMVKIKRPFWVSYDEFCASDADRTCIAFFLINCRRPFGK